MKITAIFLLLFMPMVTLAQTSQNMSQEDMQKMMQQMQKMQSCLEQIDQAELDALDQRSSKMRTKVESLCAKGKLDEAQETAISFGKEMAKDPTMQSARKCTEMVSSEMMKGMMPKFPMMDLEKDLSSRHVCDE
jgi:ABC-type phosphate transport system auxiliary subunit